MAEADGEESACQCRRCGSDPWFGKFPWRRKWQHGPLFLPGKSHRQRSLAGYSPWDGKRVGHNLATKQKQAKKIHECEVRSREAVALVMQGGQNGTTLLLLCHQLMSRYTYKKCDFFT